MASRQENLLEAERRGILPEATQAQVNEARKRGLFPAAIAGGGGGGEISPSPTIGSFIPGVRQVQDIIDIANQGFEPTEEFPFFRLPASVGERAKREQAAQQAIAGFAAPAAGAAGAVAQAVRGGAGFLGRAGASALGTGAGDIAGQLATRGEVDPVQTGISTAIGGIGQPVGEALVAGGTAVGKLGSELLANRIPSLARNRAQQVVTQALGRGGQTPEQAAQAVRGLQATGAPARVADVGGEPIQALTESIAKQPSSGADLLRRTFDPRQKLQLRRLSAQLKKGTGTRVRDIEDALLTSQSAQQAKAAPLYEAAFAKPAPASLIDDFDDLTRTGFGADAAKKAQKSLQTQFNIEDVSNVPILNRVDSTKRQLDDMIGVAKRKGANDRARQLVELKTKLVNAADEAVPEYALAREEWAGAAAWQDSVEEGLKINRAEMTPARLRQFWRTATESEKQGYRIGAVQRQLDQMGEKAAELPDLTKVLNKPNLIEKFKIIMPGGKGDAFEQALKAERQLAETGIRARGGSRTSGLEATREALDAEDRVIDALADLFQGDFRGAIARTMRLPARLKARVQEARNEEIAKILASQDPLAALAPQAGAPVAQPLSPVSAVPVTGAGLAIQDIAQ